jgi:hypothetical protein
VPAQKFHWKQLEAENYDAYISRLREVGCPESTIKAILTGELKAQSAAKRAELERRILRSSDWSPPRGVSRQEYLAAQLRKLDREIELAAGDLMQAAPGLDPLTAATAPSQDAQPPARYPAVLEDVSFQTASTASQGHQAGPSKQLNYVAPGLVEGPPEVLNSIQEIQDQFIQEVGGPNQDVEDPQYESNWRTAQWKADQILRARYGWAAYNDLVRAGVMKAQEEQQRAAAK